MLTKFLINTNSLIVIIDIYLQLSYIIGYVHIKKKLESHQAFSGVRNLSTYH